MHQNKTYYEDMDVKMSELLTKLAGARESMTS